MRSCFLRQPSAPPPQLPSPADARSPAARLRQSASAILPGPSCPVAAGPPQPGGILFNANSISAFTSESASDTMVRVTFSQCSRPRSIITEWKVAKRPCQKLAPSPSVAAEATSVSRGASILQRSRSVLISRSRAASVLHCSVRPHSPRQSQAGRAVRQSAQQRLACFA